MIQLWNNIISVMNNQLYFGENNKCCFNYYNILFHLQNDTALFSRCNKCLKENHIKAFYSLTRHHEFSEGARSLFIRFNFFSLSLFISLSVFFTCFTPLLFYTSFPLIPCWIYYLILTAVCFGKSHCDLKMNTNLVS